MNKDFDVMKFHKDFQKRWKEQNAQKCKKVKENQDIETKEVLKDIQSILDVIIKRHGKGIPKKSISGKMDCPLCKSGNRIYSVASSNGHRHSSCSTKGCMTLME